MQFRCLDRYNNEINCNVKENQAINNNLKKPQKQHAHNYKTNDNIKHQQPVDQKQDSQQPSIANVIDWSAYNPIKSLYGPEVAADYILQQGASKSVGLGILLVHSSINKLVLPYFKYFYKDVYSTNSGAGMICGWVSPPVIAVAKAIPFVAPVLESATLGTSNYICPAFGVAGTVLSSGKSAAAKSFFLGSITSSVVPIAINYVSGLLSGAVFVGFQFYFNTAGGDNNIERAAKMQLINSYSSWAGMFIKSSLSFTSPIFMGKFCIEIDKFYSSKSVNNDYIDSSGYEAASLEENTLSGRVAEENYDS